MGPRGTWLCPTPFDRERLIDMERKLARPRAVMYGWLAVVFVIAVPWFGWWILMPLAWTIVLYLAGLRPWIARSARPEYPIALSVINAQLMLGVGIALTGGPRSPALPMLLLGVVTLPARFTGRGVVAGVLFTALVMLGSSAGVDLQGYLDDPTYVNGSLGCLAGLASCSYALMRSEVDQRTRAILDPLTGLLNREALGDRFAELAEQAALTGGSVALVVCDLDRFKAVNDRFGHERGDSVLKDVAYLMRKHLRSFELVYRLGGEEFLVVLPGASLVEAEVIAERLRVAIEDGRPGGLGVTCSLGVAAGSGADVSFKPLFSRADAALYAAKRGGRNRVVALDDAGASLAA
jgi:diguanylate cyclase (GGDEF)-like protein